MQILTSDGNKHSFWLIDILANTSWQTSWYGFAWWDNKPDKTETEANYYSCIAGMLEGKTTRLIKNNTENVDSDNLC